MIQTEQSLWHLSDRGLKELHKHGLLFGDPVSKLEFCEYCINGKGHRLSFKLSTQRAKEVFEYIHSDLWGPSKVQVTSFSFL